MPVILLYGKPSSRGVAREYGEVQAAPGGACLGQQTGDSCKNTCANLHCIILQLGYFARLPKFLNSFKF